MENTQKQTGIMEANEIVTKEQIPVVQALDLQILEIAYKRYLANNKQVKVRGVTNFYVVAFNGMPPEFCFSKLQSIRVKQHERWRRTYPFDDFEDALSYFKVVAGFPTAEGSKLRVAKVISDFLADRSLVLW